MRKGYIYYKDPRDNSFVKPKQGQYYLTLDQNGLMEVRGDQGQSVSQTQFIGTGSTTPGEYLPIAGGIVNGGVLFKGDVDFTSPVEMGSINATTRISSGGTDLSVLFSNAAGPLSTYTNGADNRIITSTSANGINGESNLTFNGSALVVTGSINATTTISSGGTDLSALFSNAAGPLSTYTNGADNRIITSTAANGINGESNLTFNGSALVVTGSINATTTISSGGTDLSALFRGAGDTAGWVTNLVNYTTLNEATENPILIRTTRTTAVSAGGVYYLSTNGTWNQADASASGTSIGFLGMAQTTSSDNPGMLASGIVLIDSSSFDGTAVTGGTIYLSESTSKFTFAPPTTSGAVVRAVGHFIEDFSSGRSAYYSIYFNPSHDYFVIS